VRHSAARTATPEKIKRKKMAMEISEELTDGIAALELKGRIDSNSAPGLQDRMSELVRSGCTGLIVDFRHVAYISSAGFRALLIAAQQGEASRCAVALCGIAGEVRRMFEMGAFDQVFTILGSREECAAHLAAR
jgi:anti-sigma B factor antagonist